MKVKTILLIVAMLAIGLVAAACGSSSRAAPVSKVDKTSKYSPHQPQATATFAAVRPDVDSARKVMKISQQTACDDLTIAVTPREEYVKASVGSCPSNYRSRDPAERVAALDGYTTAQRKPKVTYTGVDNARAREKV